MVKPETLFVGQWIADKEGNKFEVHGTMRYGVEARKVIEANGIFIKTSEKVKIIKRDELKEYNLLN